jgi:hypothetical protein
VADCPNCGKQVEDGAALCPHCGYDVHSRQAGEVRRLREEGLIHPGVLPPEERGELEVEGPPPHGGSRTEMPAEDRSRVGPEDIDAGL